MTSLLRQAFPALLSALSLLATAGAAQEPCPSGPVSSIFVDNHAIFDPDDLSREQPFLWAYRLANTLHVRTRESFIASELLFEEGDCYDPVLLEESERLLRLHSFISTVDVYGLEQPDSTWHVVVDTKDEWTTKLTVRVNLEEGLEFRGIDLREENLIGRGILMGVFYREQDERRDVGARFFTPRTFGTRLDTRLSAGRTRIGRFLEEELFYPFVGEVGRVAARQLYQRRDQFFTYAFGVREPAGEEITHVLLPFEEERLEVTVAGRIGEPGNLTTLGLGVSNETLDFPDFPGGVEVARQDDFGNRDPAPAELAEQVSRQTLHSAATRLNLLVGQRNVRFERRRRLDAISGIQDVAVGTDVGLTLGRSVAALSPGEGQPDDLYGRFRFHLGATPGDLVVAGALALEGRQIFAGGGSGSGWKDIIGELDLLLYWLPEALGSHTFFARVEGAGGWSMDQPFQLTLGGPSGVRAYRESSFPGGRRIVVSVEDRIALSWPVPDLLDLGLTFFADAGRMWAGDAPFGAASGWRGAVGGGLRFGFPAGTRGVVRLDVAFPLGGGFGTPLFRVSLADLVGLAGGFEDVQLRRSRWITVGPDLFTPER